MTRLETLLHNLHAAFGDSLTPVVALGEVTLTVPADQWVPISTRLRDEAGLRFESCIDLCGVDYATYGVGKVGDAMGTAHTFPGRYAVVAHLLSIEHNWRLRIKTYTPSSEFPVLASLIEVWPGVNWYEREAFDLYGVVFEGHNDLRRILTDYGFIGHPFRKDFPLSGNVEMRYDPEQRRVLYQPVTIEPREVTPRVIREDSYGVGR